VSQSYHVRVAKDHFVFSAAHFITYDGDTCERLHGHNYRVAAEVYGELDENHYVVDFIKLRDALAAIVHELDHHVLLPTDHPRIKVEERAGEVEATFEDRRWIFPKDDCVLLPVPNTTAELVARYIGGRLLGDLQEKTGHRPARIRVEVDECCGQIGVVELCDE